MRVRSQILVAFLCVLLGANTSLANKRGKSRGKGKPAATRQQTRQSPKSRSSQRRHASRLNDLIVKPLLAEGRAGKKVSAKVDNRTGTVHIQTPRGKYAVKVTKHANPADIGNTYAPLRRDKKGVLSGEAYIHPESISDAALRNPEHQRAVRGFVRTLLRGDEWVHPHIPRPGESPGEFRPSELQALALTQLKNTRRAHRKKLTQERRQVPSRAALILPGGLGKTVVAMMDAHQFFGGDPVLGSAEKRTIPEDGLVIVTVQDLDILNSFQRKLKPYFNLDANQVAVRYGKRSQRSPITKNTRLILITRSTFQNEKESILKLATNGKKRKRTYTVIDEAHNAGLQRESKDGQYEQIVAALNKNLGSESFINFQSATLWHRSSEILTDSKLVDRSIVAPLATPSEMTRLRDGKDVEQLGVDMMLRAGYMGLASPWKFAQVATVINEKGDNRLFYRDANSKAKDAQKTTIINTRLVEELAGDIAREQKKGVPGRVLIFARGQEKIDILATELRKQLRVTKQGANAEVFSYHSNTKRLNSPVDWFSNLSSPELRVLIVDRKFKEGVDAPPTDLVVVLRAVNLAEPHQVRDSIQNLTRASRLSPGKTGYGALDYSGRIAGLTNLPERMEKQETPPHEPNDFEGKNPKEHNVARRPVTVMRDRREVQTPQRTRLGEKTRIQKTYAKRPKTEIIQAASPFADSKLTKATLNTLRHLQTATTKGGERLKKVAKLPFGQLILSQSGKLLATRERILANAKELRDIADYTEDPDLSDSDLDSLHAQVRELESAISNDLNQVLDSLLYLDPHKDSEVTLTFRAPDGQNSRSSPQSSTALRDFFRATLRDMKRKGPKEVKITNGERPTLVVKGGHAFAMFRPDTRLSHRVYRNEGAKKRKHTHAVQVWPRLESGPSYKAALTGLMRSTFDQSLGVTLDLSAKTFKLPGGSEGSLRTNFTQNTAAPKSEHVDVMYEQKWRINLQHYMLNLLAKTVNPGISRAVK